MKKITLLILTFLTMSLGHSQTACTGTSSDTVNGTFSYNYSFDTNGSNVIIMFQINENFAGLVGQLEQTPGPVYSNMTNTGMQTFTVTLTGQVDGTVLNFAFFGPYAGGQVLRTVSYSYTVGTTCAPIPANQNVTLSDLKLDGTTIAGFSSAKKTYSIGVPNLQPTPQITAATTTNTLATVGAFNQASGVPGNATFEVTAEDGITKATYTVSFFTIGPSIAAPTPPARVAADVVSIYSDAYAVIPAINLDQGWCDGTGAVQATTAGGNAVLAYKGKPCQGIDFDANRQNLTGFTRLHVDLFIQAGTDLVGKVFNLKTVPDGTGTVSEFNIDINGLNPKPVPGTWYSYDKPITFSGPTTSTRQVGVTSNLNNVVWYDNLYFHKNTTLGTEDFKIAGLNVYPNPSKNSWTVKTSNINMSAIKVYDILGKNVLSLTPNANDVTINGSSLKSGLYFAQIKTESGVSSIKLVKE